MKQKNNYFILTILLSFVAGYIQTYSDNLFYLLCFAIILSNGIFLYANIDWNKPFSLSFYLANAVYLGLLILFITFWMRFFISLAFFAYILVVILTFVSIDYPLKALTKVLNKSFIVYSVLSLLLYFGLIPIGRELNWFPVSIFGIEIQTMVGFLGSTAWIDGFAMIICLMNVHYKLDENWKKYAIISGFMAFLTFRSTPYLLLIAFLGILLLNKLVKQRVVLLIPLTLIFGSFFIPKLILMYTRDEQLFAVIDYALTGRAHLWTTVLDALFEKPLNTLLIGYGNMNNFPVPVWHGILTNPHNAFFRLFIEGGVIFYSTFFVALAYAILKVQTKHLPIIFIIITQGISNSMIFQFQNLSMVYLLAALIADARFENKTINE